MLLAKINDLFLHERCLFFRFSRSKGSERWSCGEEGKEMRVLLLVADRIFSFTRIFGTYCQVFFGDVFFQRVTKKFLFSFLIEVYFMGFK